MFCSQRICVNQPSASLSYCHVYIWCICSLSWVCTCVYACMWVYVAPCPVHLPTFIMLLTESIQPSQPTHTHKHLYSLYTYDVMISKKYIHIYILWRILRTAWVSRPALAGRQLHTRLSCFNDKILNCMILLYFSLVFSPLLVGCLRLFTLCLLVGDR